MKFGRISLDLTPPDDAEGAILAHSIRLPDGAIRKGTQLTARDLERLRAAGIDAVTAARLEPGDVLEDDAATRIAAALTGPDIEAGPAATGRVNLYAAREGVLGFTRSHLVDLNLIDEGLTVATLAANSRVGAGRMVATVKIIPYALPGATVDRALQLIASSRLKLALAPFVPHRVGMVLTHTADTKPSLLEKRVTVNAARLTELGSTLVATRTVAHNTAEVAQAISALAALDLDPILVFGASAISDRCDIIPEAIRAAGGAVTHFGMPVDPGNLLLLGSLGSRTVIGVPSCASSPKLNGLDWVLERTLAGLETTALDIAEMAPGGLLMEISSRPQPREPAENPLGPRPPPPTPQHQKSWRLSSPPGVRPGWDRRTS